MKKMETCAVGLYVTWIRRQWMIFQNILLTLCFGYQTHTCRQTWDRSHNKTMSKQKQIARNRDFVEKHVWGTQDLRLDQRLLILISIIFSFAHYTFPGSECSCDTQYEAVMAQTVQCDPLSHNQHLQGGPICPPTTPSAILVTGWIQFFVVFSKSWLIYWQICYLFIANKWQMFNMIL